ncbi:hypothetical protein [Mesorhizobium sp. B1-1-8]|uniref:hypothetical protein n=1 Tax=Mesorhizobium sp. B1-1-8 TaxID=2589976 RepID=UPI00112DE2E6|nr:hypothetical protein [Mesorhizobium sp. B1-1-8]UCI10721.1 hypothetical protein FJ974_28570 [Mesorhizobium sp. B1-1-8]
MRAWLSAFVQISAVLLLTACGTPKEKSAPCKRPPDVSSYTAEPRLECGPVRPVNPDRRAALAAIDGLALQSE